MNMKWYNVNDLFNSKELQKQVTNNAGIYIFKNLKNNKYYIGQAIRIRKRLTSHISNYNNSRYDNPLYKAFNKYGLDRFEYSILEEIPGTDYREIRKQLDILEVKYIKEYNSYTNGYNQTRDGDGGILGYKFTEEQSKKQSENRIKYIEESLVDKIYFYNIETKETHMFIAASYADKYFGWKPGSAKGCDRYLITHKKYISARDEDTLKKKIEYLKSNPNYNHGKFTYKYTKEEYSAIKKDHPDYSYVELADFMGVCRKTIYNYEKALGNNITRVFKAKITNINTSEELIVTAKEGAKYFNTTEDNFRKTVYRCDKDKHLYRKIYKLEKYKQID